jgi:DNA-directed RNA polymerase subunit H
MAFSNREMLKVKYESLKMLESRGYAIAGLDQSVLQNQVSERDFVGKYTQYKSSPVHPLYNSLFKNSLQFRTYLSNVYYRDRSSCLVYFAEYEETKLKKISNDQISEFCKLIIETGVDEAILVSNVQPSIQAYSLFTEICKAKNSVFIQFFSDEELLFNPLDHVLTPKHRIISEKEKRELIEEGITLEKIPKISVLDPVAKRLGVRTDDVIEINRKVLVEDNLVEEEISYRYAFMPRVDKLKK